MTANTDLWPDRPRLAVRVKPVALREIRRGHPWVYESSIVSVSDGGEAGDLAVVFDEKRRFAAIGLYDPESPIRLRVLHVGKPTTIDDSWLTTTVAAALERRRQLIERPDTNAYRLVHGENDGLGGLVADFYNGHIVVKLYTRAWLPWLPAIADAVNSAATAALGKGAVRSGWLRTSRTVATPTSRQQLWGETPTAGLEILENGLRFGVDVVDGHKTGHFLDQRANRRLIGDHSRDRSVLDVFSCTGGFSVHAAAGGARKITALDASGPALSQVGANLALNGFSPDAGFLNTVKGDAFEELLLLVEQGRTYDLVVIDPPSMASRQTQVSRALSAYGRLAELGGRLTARGGVLYLASCTARVGVDDFRNACHRGLARADRSHRLVTETGHDVDHPIGFEQGRYLNGLLLSL